MNLMPKLSNRKLTLVTIFWIFSLIWASLTGFSQSIYIYDDNFSLAIRSACPTCIGPFNNLLSPAATLTRLDVSNWNIADLSGLEGFTSLDTLLCNNNQLTRLPTLPKNLTSLSCFKNQLTCLPALPNSLKFLRIDADKVTCFVNSVNGLKVYDAANNLIASPPICTYIPDEGFAETIRRVCPDCIGPCNNLLPPAAAITSLFINAYYIQDIKGIENFTSLQSLTINFAQLKSLPTLPNSLKELHCTRTLITNLSPLPSNLEILDLSYNRLTSLPTLPNGLISLICPFNQLKSLPTLSESLLYLDCQDNLISKLPALTDKLWSLNCANNQLSCLPFLPLALKSLSIYGNSITCLPNKVGGLLVQSGTGTLLPICSVPDQNFVKAIKNSCPSCMDSCYRLLPAASSLTSLDVSNQGISDLTGINLFSALQTLNISNNPLTCLPVLPVTLTKLIVNPNEVKCLPKLIPGLQVYNKNNEQIATPPVCPLYIPDSNFALAIRRTCFSCIDDCNYLLPPAFTLKSLNISEGKITSLSGIDQFTSLETLDCSYNLLTELPGLPLSLKSLNCSYNKLTSLPSLPVTLTKLECNNNKLEHLPALPDKLSWLSCANNQLNCLPFLPNTLVYLVIAGNSKIICLPNRVKGLYIVYNQGIFYLPVCGVADANFLKVIQNNCPNCIDSCYNLLPGVTDITVLDVSNKNITDLTGISAFIGLKTLDCSKNSITCLPALPATLSKLVIDADKIRCLPNLIPGLQVYDSAGNLITTPPVCPFFIPDINFANAIRSHCPKCIDDCNFLLTPASELTSLLVANSKISNLTGLEGFPSLVYLYCSSNQITSLPTLPNNLTHLSCASNQLTSLPTLPENLTYLSCELNQVTSLPDLPNSLVSMYCTNNKLLSLPPLPVNLERLHCSNNQITCLPLLPNFLIELSIDSNMIRCLPNTVAGLKVYDQNLSSISMLPLCPVSLMHPTGLVPTGTYIATQTIESGASLSVGGTNYHAGQSITLKPGFQTLEGRTFSVEVRGCN
ncbi:3-coathanger stack domain-containing protein [Runella limosa]|uniref:3-coathanger stack domain-containing protein n=1 Tax=Runella limosa TaxID=370978 RepID=UPI00041C54B2|nr:3-coathanger stack domain-containing protein [Runella limosa]